MDINVLTKKQLISHVMTLQAELRKLQKQKSNSIKTTAIDIADAGETINKFFDNFPDMVFTLKPDGEILWVNKLGAKSLGYTKTELIGQPVWKVVHADYLDDVKSKIAAILKNKKKDSELDFCKVKKDGSILYVHEKAQLIFSSDGKIEHIRIICRDITKIKLAEAALIKEEEKYRTITNNLNVGIYRSTTNENGKLLDFNSAFMRIFGYNDKQELFDVPALSLYLHHHDRKSLLRTIEKKGSVKNKEVLLVKKDGTRFLGSITAVLSKDKTGKVTYYGGIVEDITDRKKAEEALIESEHKYRTLVESFNDIIFITDYKSRMLYANPALKKQTGYSILDFQMEQMENPFIHPDDLKMVGKFIERFVKSRKQHSDTIENRFIDKSGKCHWYSSVISKIEFNHVPALQFIVRDISKRKEALEKLYKSEEQYRTLFNFSPDGILIENMDGLIIDVNPAFCKIMGYKKKDLLNKHVRILSDPSTVDRVNKNVKKLNQGISLKHIEKSVKKDGTRVLMELNERKFILPDGGAGIICIAEDITERAKALERLENSEESYRGLFNSTTDAIYMQDKNGRFVDVNDGAIKMYGYPRSYFIGKTPDFLSAPGMNDLQKAFKMIQAAFKGKPQIFEFWGIDRKGRIFPKEVRLNKGKYFGEDVVIAFAQDITERKNAEKILQESEKKYRKIFNAFPDVYFKSDKNGVIEEISPSVERITGYLPKELIGMPSRQFYHFANDWDRIGELLNNTGKVQDFDTEIKTKENGTISCSLTASIIFDKNDTIIGVEGVLRDITDRKKAENKLRESQRRLSTLMGNLPGMAYRCRNDKDWTMDFVSEGCKNLTGYKSSELINNSKVSYNDLIHPDDQSMVWDVVQEGILKHESYKLVYRLIAKDGKLKWVWEQGTGIYSDDDKLLALEGFISNISEQKLAEEEIRKFSRSVEQSPTIVVITNLKGAIEYVNPKFTAVTGYTAAEVLNKNPRILKSGKTPDETYLALWQTISSGKDWFGEFINKKKNGEYYWESANIFPLKDDKGKITHFIAMKEDITVRKAMEQDLIKAKEKAEESDKLKSAFLANMSHEIRTPMNAIIGFSQLLSEPDITPQEQSHYISLIQKSGGDLLGLIDDIIDISKIEAGQLKVFKSDYFVETILTEIHDSYIEYLKTTNSAKDLSFKYKRSERLKNVVIHTDIDKLKQVLRNLINNALKFTDFGLVEFGAEVKNDGLNSFIQFYVRDTGIGMPNDKLDVIFESFRQLDVTNTRLYGGTGLGLAITKKIVEFLGGNIWVKSTQGQGSTFYFTLPYNPILIKAELKTNIPDLSGIKNYNWADKQILIVEDDDQSFLFYQSVLKKTQIQISRATDGNEAIDKFYKQNFDLILMDIRMPKMDGYVTAESILLHNPRAKIIAQTAYAIAGERQRCLDAGCVDYITKPIKIASFLQIIEKYI